MRDNAKSTLLNFAYYGMIIVMLALIVSLFVGLNANDFAMWVKVCYSIIAIMLLLIVIYDIICIYTDMSCYIAGFALIANSILTVIVSFILYARFSVRGGLVGLANLNYFIFAVGTLVAINLLTICIYIAGLYIKQGFKRNTPRIAK